MHRVFSNILYALILPALLGICVPGIARAVVIADFENFAEGHYGGTPLLDPISGIVFSNPISANSNFIVEFSSAWPTRPLTSPGNILTTNGYTPGPGWGLGHQFSFTGTLPAATGLLQMEMVYAVTGAAQVTLTGFNSTNGQVASTVFTANTGAFLETTLNLSSPGNDISWFTVTSTDISNGFDNIRFTPVPEPSALAAVAIGAAALLRRPARRQ